MFTTNPYSNRKAIVDPREFYNRGTIIEQIVRNLPQNCNIVGEPRIGRSSVLHYLAHPNGARQKSGVRSYLSNHLLVLIDLQRLPIRSDFGLWRYLLDRLAGEAKAEECESEEMQRLYDMGRRSRDLYEVQFSFEEYLKKLSRIVVLLFDDFEVVINEFAEDEVIHTTSKLRAIFQSGYRNNIICFVIASSDPVYVLFEKRELPRGRWSQFTNILKYLSLGLLEEEAVDRMIREPIERLGLNDQVMTYEYMKFIHLLAGRHPDLIKLVCSHVFEARKQGCVDYEQLRQKIEIDPHVVLLMNLLWERVKDADASRGTTLETTLVSLAVGKEAVDSKSLHELCSRGLIEYKDHIYHFFAAIFQDFIKSRISSMEGFNVSEVLGTAGRHSYNPQSKSQNIEIDPATRKVRLHGREVALTRLEFKLFSYLVNNKGRTCTQEELKEAVWGKARPDTRDALEQIVRRVRQKVEPDARNPQLLLSIRKQGYLFRNGSV